MTPPPARTHLTASVLALCVLLGATGCSVLSTPPTAEPAPIVPTTSASAKSPATSGSPVLTQAQAQAALVTDADLGEPWTPTQGAATWRDGLLKAKTDRPDCRRLLDALYADQLFGADADRRAVVGLDDEWNEAQLHYQVVARKRADVNRTLAWLRTLPKKCGRFAAKTVADGVQDVQVTALELPEAGDARQGLRVMMTGESPDGEPTTLTLDVAAVRVGDDAIGLTNGGLGDVLTDATQTAVQLGAERLKEIRKQARVQV